MILSTSKIHLTSGRSDTLERSRPKLTHTVLPSDLDVGEYLKFWEKHWFNAIKTRSCPGKELADASLFAAIVASIAVFEIKRAEGEEGKDVSSYMVWNKEFVRFAGWFFLLHAYWRTPLKLPCYFSMPNQTTLSKGKVTYRKYSRLSSFAA